MNLAYLWGVKNIILLGFDFGKSKDGKAHWFGQHPAGLTQSQPFEYWLKTMPALASDLALQGVRVINASPETALTCFERMPIEQALLECGVMRLG